MADRKNKLGLSVAIGAGVGAAPGVALHHLPLWLSLGLVMKACDKDSGGDSGKRRPLA